MNECPECESLKDQLSDLYVERDELADKLRNSLASFTTKELLEEIGQRAPQECKRCGELYPAYATHYCGTGWHV